MPDPSEIIAQKQGAPSLFRIETEAGCLAGSLIGIGQPVVLWPSLFTDRHMYDRVIPLLAKGNKLIMFDPPGHGQSKIGGKTLTLAGTARASLHVLDQLGIRQFRWVGTSWGGMIGALVAIIAPSRVLHLACLNTPFALHARPDLGTRLIVSGARWIGRTSLFANGVARSHFLNETLRTQVEFMDRHRAVFLEGNAHELFLAARHVLIQRENLKPLLHDIRTPTLVAAGGQDAYPVSSFKKAADLIPGSEFHVVEKSRHISAADAPDEIALLLHSAWARVASAGNRNFSITAAQLPPDSKQAAQEAPQ
jgi:3-oxoadipate enol-lactonase